jgi:hypothetical protein
LLFGFIVEIKNKAIRFYAPEVAGHLSMSSGNALSPSVLNMFLPFHSDFDALGHLRNRFGEAEFRHQQELFY